MIILSWNCRGLGHPSAVSSLRDQIWCHKPEVVFLCETLYYGGKLEEIRRLLGYEASFVVDRDGRSGGLAMLWKEAHYCEVLNYSQNHINLLVKKDEEHPWRVIGFYGIANRNRRRESWSLLRSLADHSNLPWCVIGDFNDILSQEEKRGRVEHPNWLMAGFRQATMDCGLIDIPLQGHSYTWWRSLGSSDAAEEQLDRAIASENWLSMFPQSCLCILIAAVSDHSPILLDTEVRQYVFRYRKFRFENSWLVEPELDGVLTDGWNKGVEEPLLMKLQLCTEDLDAWGRSLRKRYREDIELCKKRIYQVQEMTTTEAATN